MKHPLTLPPGRPKTPHNCRVCVRVCVCACFYLFKKWGPTYEYLELVLDDDIVN